MAAFTVDLPDELLHCFYTGGRWIPGTSTRRVTLVSPATEEEMLSLPLANGVEVARAVAAARAAFDSGPWPRMSAAERAGYLQRFADEIRARLGLLARLWTAQVGAPLRFAEGLIHAGESRFDHFAQLLDDYAFSERRSTARGHARIVREPVGVAALIAPWNATFNIFAHKIPAALAAGCTVVLKSPVESPLDALVIAQAADAAGLPPGVLNVITADTRESAQLVESQAVDKISFTGSVPTGRRIAEAAARRMARTTLELGGKSAAILLDDVDLSTALPALTPFTMPFSGQICFSQTRILAPLGRLTEVAEAYTSSVRALRVGDPWDPATDLGPVLNARQYQRVLGYVEAGRREGARLLTGGGRSAGFDRGHYLDPTVFTDVTPEMTIAREEIFGPVVTVQGYQDVDEAVRLANDTDFGLSGSVFGADAERAFEVALRVNTGHLAVNGFEISPNVPFGGRKLSGLGREGGPEGLESFLETKAVFMPTAP
ncbi:aldehyde dehydrogenase family protein [Streptomyces tendae]|uniref:aldehyde dehydrogenase family protein n=1 Tax=Streptomyces tendae TaxID=1932 RepID=UPI00167260D5|nr:aldehyde dehydrogenase family protein [Streptomyces tendae]